MASLTAAFKAALADVDAKQTNEQLPQQPGTIREDLNNVFKYVEFAGTTTVSAGDVVCYVSSDTTLGTVDGANTAFPAGISYNTVSSGSVQYSWVQLKGVASLSHIISGTSTFGEPLVAAAGVAPALSSYVGSGTAPIIAFAVTSNTCDCNFPQ